MLRKYFCLCLTALLIAATPMVASATVRKVYVGGTNTGGTYDLSHLQQAIDDAAQNDACGSEILIQTGASFTASGTGFILRKLIAATPTWDCITIRTGVDSSGNVLSAASFPAAGIRVTTSSATNFAKFYPGTNNEAAIRTVYPGETGAGCSSIPCVGSGWTLKFLEFGPKIDWASRALVRFGTNNAGKELLAGVWVNTLPGGETQDTLVEVPQYLTLIQCYVHGDAYIGQHQGLILASKDARVYHNLFDDIKSLTETQAITGLNGIGPYDIWNNQLSATGENVMWGGADTYLRLSATVTGTPTTTSIPLTSPQWEHLDGTQQTASFSTDIYSGIYISITHAGTDYGGIVCTFSGSTCTVPTLPFTPSAGDTVRWTWQMGGLTFRQNYVLKKGAWINPIVTTTAGVALTPQSGGSLTAGTYCYRVATRAFVSGASPVATSPASAEQCQTVNGTTQTRVHLSWTADSHASTYRVYVGPTGAENHYFDVTAPTATFDDTGAAGTAGTPPVWGAIWVVKNNFELKQGDGASPMGAILIEGNRFDWSWCCSQSNFISLKVNNQNANDVSATIRSVTFRNNWINHGNRAVALTCTTTGNTAPQAPSGPMTDVIFSNNLFTDLNTYVNTDANNDGILDSTGNSVLLMTTGSYANEVGSKGCIRVSWLHNTFLAEADSLTGPFWLNLNSTTDKMVDLIVRDNIMARDCITSGCVSGGVRTLKGFAPGNLGNNVPTTAWNGTTQGSSAIDHNAWPDGTNTQYTAGPFTSSFFPTDAALKSTHLVDYNNCNTGTDISGCGLQATSNMHNAASDSTDLGANVATIKTFTDVAFSGDTTGGGGGGGGGTPVVITTTSLVSAVTRNSYSATITATGGTAPYTCSKVSGSLPVGITLSSACVLSGTANTVGTYTFTVRATDTLAAIDDQVLTLRTRSRRPASTTGTNERFNFSAPVAPSPANDRDVLAGDLWSDTSVTPPLLKWCKAATAYSCTTWEQLNGAGGTTALSGLSDVAIATPTSNQFLRYNSGTSKWNNATVNVFTQGGNAFGATATFGTTDNFAFNIMANNIARFRAETTLQSASMQAQGDNNPEIYVMKNDLADWMNMGFNASDGRRVVAQIGSGTRRSYQALAGTINATDYTWGVATSANSGSTITRWLGLRHDGLFSVKHLSLETGTRPTCSASERGTFWYVAGATGVKDTVEVCAKDSSDSYAWRTIY